MDLDKLLKLIPLFKGGARELMSVMDDAEELSGHIEVIAANTKGAIMVSKRMIGKLSKISDRLDKEDVK